MPKEQFDKHQFCSDLSAMHSSKLRFDANDNAVAIRLHNLMNWINKHPILFMFSRKKILSDLSDIKEANYVAHCVVTDCFNHSDQALKALEHVCDADEYISHDCEQPVGINVCPVCGNTDIGVKDNISSNKVWAYCRCCGTKGPVLSKNQFSSDDESIGAAYDAWNWKIKYLK